MTMRTGKPTMTLSHCLALSLYSLVLVSYGSGISSRSWNAGGKGPSSNFGAFRVRGFGTAFTLSAAGAANREDPTSFVAPTVGVPVLAGEASFAGAGAGFAVGVGGAALAAVTGDFVSFFTVGITVYSETTLGAGGGGAAAGVADLAETVDAGAGFSVFFEGSGTVEADEELGEDAAGVFTCVDETGSFTESVVFGSGEVEAFVEDEVVVVLETGDVSLGVSVGLASVTGLAVFVLDVAFELEAAEAVGALVAGVLVATALSLSLAIGSGVFGASGAGGELSAAAAAAAAFAFCAAVMRLGLAGASPASAASAAFCAAVLRVVVFFAAVVVLAAPALVELARVVFLTVVTGVSAPASAGTAASVSAAAAAFFLVVLGRVVAVVAVVLVLIFFVSAAAVSAAVVTEALTAVLRLVVLVVAALVAA